MKKLGVMAVLIFLMMAAGCATTGQQLKEMVMDKTYNVIFEDKPDLTSDQVTESDIQIGKVLDKTLASNNMVVVKISIQNKFNDMMKDNVVFYVTKGKLEYEAVGKEGKPLEEGAKILGFTGWFSFNAFKAQYTIKNISDAAVFKAQELYNKAFK